MSEEKQYIDFVQAIKERAKVLQAKGLSKFETALFLTFTLLPFFSLETKKKSDD